MDTEIRPPLRVLITNIALDRRSGTETVVRDLAGGLHRRGHLPMVYSPALGGIAAELAAVGIPVFNRIEATPRPPDVIHGHHLLQTGIAATAFPWVPAIFVCHDAVAWHDAAPRLANIVRYVAVGDSTRLRLTGEGEIPADSVRVIENGVDLERFRPGPTAPAAPRRALLVAKTAASIAPVVAACRARGIEIDVVGHAVGCVLEQPEEVFPHYDLIFASGLAALESMACARPVVLCDQRGLAGFVDVRGYRNWRPSNFGLGALQSPLTEAALLTAIDAYSATEAAAVARMVRTDASAERWLDRYLDLYREVLDGCSCDAPQSGAPRHLAVNLERWYAGQAGQLHEGFAALGEGAAELDLPPLPLDTHVAVGDRSRFALFGLECRDGWAWSIASWCGFVFRRPAGSGRLSCRLEYIVEPTATMDGQHLHCLVNGREIDGAIEYDIAGSVCRCKFPLAAGSGSLTVVSFRLPDRDTASATVPAFALVSVALMPA